jgi:hypothetical protein
MIDILKEIKKRLFQNDLELQNLNNIIKNMNLNL